MPLRTPYVSTGHRISKQEHERADATSDETRSELVQAHTQCRYRTSRRTHVGRYRALRSTRTQQTADGTCVNARTPLRAPGGT
eukprot:1726674-Rhodomonas_salina.3